MAQKQPNPPPTTARPAAPPAPPAAAAQIPVLTEEQIAAREPPNRQTIPAAPRTAPAKRKKPDRRPGKTKEEKRGLPPTAKQRKQAELVAATKRG